jgi:hypothetical protein
MEDELWNNGSQTYPLFGGHQNWSQREESFKLNSTMKVKQIFCYGQYHVSFNYYYCCCCIVFLLLFVVVV